MIRYVAKQPRKTTAGYSGLATGHARLVEGSARKEPDALQRALDACDELANRPLPPRKREPLPADAVYDVKYAKPRKRRVFRFSVDDAPEPKPTYPYLNMARKYT